jgi:hypothetical protein
MAFLTMEVMLSGSSNGPAAASVLQAFGFRWDVTVFRLNARPRPNRSEPAFRRNTAERAYMTEAAHNPEVAGSNPAPLPRKGPGDRAFLLRAQHDGFSGHT